MTREIDQKKPFNTDYFEDYYTDYRNKFEDLFDSEKKFMNEFSSLNGSYLDIGCALGGMYEILHALNPKIHYTGIDIAPKLLAIAKKKYPDCEFRLYDGISLPYDNNTFDRILTLGTTVHDPNFTDLLLEAYRVTKDALFFDIRLIQNMPTISSMDKGHVLDGSGVKYPYVIANYSNFIETLSHLSPSPLKIKGYGYWGKANEDAVLAKGYEKICMATFLLYKSDKQFEKTSFDLSFPF